MTRQGGSASGMRPCPWRDATRRRSSTHTHARYMRRGGSQCMDWGHRRWPADCAASCPPRQVSRPTVQPPVRQESYVRRPTSGPIPHVIHNPAFHIATFFFDNFFQKKAQLDRTRRASTSAAPSSLTHTPFLLPTPTLPRPPTLVQPVVGSRRKWRGTRKRGAGSGRIRSETGC